MSSTSLVRQFAAVSRQSYRSLRLARPLSSITTQARHFTSTMSSAADHSGHENFKGMANQPGFAALSSPSSHFP